MGLTSTLIFIRGTYSPKQSVMPRGGTTEDEKGLFSQQSPLPPAPRLPRPPIGKARNDGEENIGQ